MVLLLFSSVSFSFVIGGSLKMSPPPPSVNYSWQETTFSKSRVLVWTDDSYVVNDSGSYTTDIYSGDYYKYNISGGYVIRETPSITMDANFTSSVNVTTSGNSTINIDVDVYQVNVDYAQHVDFMWFAAKNGTLEYEYYLSKRVEDYSYWEENHRHIETTYEKFDLTTWELIDTWNDTTDEYEVINVTHTSQKEFYPFFEHMYYTSEFVMPLFLTVQIFKTQGNDRIAWANMFFNFIIFKDKDQNGILTVGNEPTYSGPPGIASSTEWCGNLDAMALSQHGEFETNETVYPITENSRPIDKPLSEISSSIIFTPPTEISGTEVSWDIQYTDFPLAVMFHDDDLPSEEWYAPPNTYNELSPTNLSYAFDFIVNETQADFDITWGIGKITNDTAYNAIQGYGLVIPQYNFFLSTFDIDEIDQMALSVPRDKFSFKSNNTVVAEINMGKPEKKNYTLFDFPSPSIDTEFESIGGSIHKNAIGFASQSSYYDNPLISTLFALDDIVAQDTSFVVQDSLFSMETQNYPLWNGEKLIHDPSLSIYFAGMTGADPIEDPPDDPPNDPSVPTSLIPSYNLPILIGVVSVLITVITIKLRRRLKT